MTNKELQEELKKYPDDAEVFLYDAETEFSFEVGMIWHSGTNPPDKSSSKLGNEIYIEEAV